MIGLLMGLLFCHYLGDFTHLSRPYMLKAKATGRPLGPIFHHANVHGILMWLFVWAVKDFAAGATTYAIVMSSHLWIDVLKGRLNVWYPQLSNPANPWHWYVFGGDQLIHILVIILVTQIV